MDFVSLGIGLAVVVMFFALRGGKDKGSKSSSIPVGLNVFEMAIVENAAYKKEMVYFTKPHFDRLAWFFKIVNGKPKLIGSLNSRIDKSIQLCKDAGIDYMIYHAPGIRGGFGLLPPLQRHISSPTTMRYVWSLFGSKQVDWSRSETEKMVDLIVARMKDPRWQKINGRPLFQVLRPMRFQHLGLHKTVRMIRQKCKAAGVGNPLVVAQGVEVGEVYKHQYGLKKAGFDVLTEYSPTYGAGKNVPGKSMSYKGATTTLINSYAKAKALPIIPYGMFEAYPKPRADYRGRKSFHHYEQSGKGEITERIRKVNSYAKDHRNNCFATSQWYSMGERSEFGCMLPTMTNRRIYNEAKKGFK